MRKSMKIALLLIAAVLAVLLLIEYSGINAKYKTPQTIKVNEEAIKGKDPQ